jgi:hypothetical protein
VNFHPRIPTEIIERVMWGIFALLLARLLVRVFVFLMREIERLP